MEEYINEKTDIDFWFLLFLKKLKDEKRNEFFLSEIYREEFYNSNTFLNEFKNDGSGYATLEEFSLNRVNEILSDCSFGKIDKLEVIDTNSIPLKITKELLTRKEHLDDIDEYIIQDQTDMIYKYAELEVAKNTRDENSEITVFSLHEISNHLGELISLVPEYTKIYIEWHDVAEFDFQSLVELNNTQLESFYKHVKQLNAFENKVNIPINAFQEKDFDIAKTLYYLDSKNKIKVIDFFTRKKWEVEFIGGIPEIKEIYNYRIDQRDSEGYFFVVEGVGEIFVGKSNRDEVKLLQQFKTSRDRKTKDELGYPGNKFKVSFTNQRRRINEGITDKHNGLNSLEFELRSQKINKEFVYLIDKIIKNKKDT